MESSLNEGRHYPVSLKIWLLTGVFMLFIQIMVGGITRLTGSGLSITKWEIITGTLPPLNAQQWDAAFDLYKATPQYRKINKGMSLDEFKFIYFWEYIHRLWARTMGLVFIIPFVYFLLKGRIDRRLMKKLGIVVLLAALAASFGWIMVHSGLKDRPWVNAYKLAVHLGIALSVYGYLFWTTLQVWKPQNSFIHIPMLKKGANVIFALLAVQLLLGGMMSGMKAGILYPTWPDMNGVFIPDVLLTAREWTLSNFMAYDTNPFMAALVQFSHRLVAYVLTIIVLWFSWKIWRDRFATHLRSGTIFLCVTLGGQILLGILTVVHCKGTIPVGLGVFHQAGAVLLLTAVLNLLHQFGHKKISN